MGEVYRAKDTRLDRIVAIKVLPEHLAENPERKQRFEREARTISQLNHPHICTLYDVSEHDGVDFLVMECIEGETLATRLERGALPFDQALDYAEQIAGGLDTAHRSGIVHRDVKPGNVMLIKDGVKLLDFGLAKVVEDKTPTNDSSAPTEQRDLHPISDERAILGTPQYMAPEQLQGDPVDARTDIFAFGTLLYEMVTGKKAFEGRSGASLAGAILKDDVLTVSPPALDHLVQTCVAKDPDERWQSAGDVARQLKWIAETATQTQALAQPRRTNALVGTLLLLVGILGGLLVWSLAARAPKATLSSLEFEVTLPPTDRIFPAGLALSPDGSTLVYVARRNDIDQLFRHDLDRVDPSPIDGTENAESPFFSLDGQWIGFAAEEKLQKVSIAGGPPQILCALSNRLMGGTWIDADTIVFGSQNSSLQRVSASGGDPKPLTSLEDGDLAHQWPTALPDRETILFTSVPNSAEAERWIVMERLDSGERYRLARGEAARFLESGHLVIARGDSLWSAPFDPEKPDVLGEAVPVLDDVGWTFAFRRRVAHFAIADNGTLAYSPGGAAAFRSELVEMTRDGARLRALDLPGAAPAFSPDGSQLAAHVTHPRTGGDIWLYDLKSGRSRRFTTHPSVETTPAWAHDGMRVFFSSGRLGAGLLDIFEKSVVGNDEPTLLFRSDELKHVTSASADGRFVVFDSHKGIQQDLWILPLTGDGSPEPVVDTEFDEDDGAISPDGRWFAYASTQTGRYEVYVIPFRREGRPTQVSLDGAKQPKWRGDSRELFYLTLNGTLMAVAFEDGEVGHPEPLFDSGISNPESGGLQWEVAADGQRFIVSVPAPDSTTRRIRVVLDWAARLE